MDHLVIPLDEPHAEALARLARQLERGAGLRGLVEPPVPHVTVVAYRGLDRAAALGALAPVAATSTPFHLHAHAYGFFTSGAPADLSLHIPVVRGPQLERLHRRVCAALRCAGAEVAGWTTPETWAPHVTLLDRGLDGDRLGRATAWLARRHHPSWRVPVDRVEVTGGWLDRWAAGSVLPLGG